MIGQIPRIALIVDGREQRAFWPVSTCAGSEWAMSVAARRQ
jgi:hypothetical protein